MEVWKTTTRKMHQTKWYGSRDAVVNAAERAEVLKQKAVELAQKAGTKWDESKPRRQKAAEDLKRAGERVVRFGKDVGEGLKEGVAEVQKRRKN